MTKNTRANRIRKLAAMAALSAASFAPAAVLTASPASATVFGGDSDDVIFSAFEGTASPPRVVAEYDVTLQSDRSGHLPEADFEVVVAFESGPAPLPGSYNFVATYNGDQSN